MADAAVVMAQVLSSARPTGSDMVTTQYAVIYDHSGAEMTNSGEWGEERIVYADIQLHTIDYSKYLADRVGHYSRPEYVPCRGASRSSSQK
jgi:hypothetical protein